jgi:hypothetical protein
MAVVLRRLGEPGRVVDAVVVEKHALNFMAHGQCGDHKLVGAVDAWCV